MCTNLRNIDSILLIYPCNPNIQDIIKKLDNTEPSTEFKHEFEINKSLPLRDIVLIRNNNKLNFRLYHEATSKNDLINHKILPQKIFNSQNLGQKLNALKNISTFSLSKLFQPQC